MVYEELGLKHVLETTGIIQSIIRAVLHIHDVRHSKNSRLIRDCTKTDNHSMLQTQLSHPAQYESYTTRTELNPVHK